MSQPVSLDQQAECVCSEVACLFCTIWAAGDCAYHNPGLVARGLTNKSPTVEQLMHLGQQGDGGARGGGGKRECESLSGVGDHLASQDGGSCRGCCVSVIPPHHQMCHALTQPHRLG